MYAEVRSLIRKDIPIWDRDICIDFLECFEPALPQTTLLLWAWRNGKYPLAG